jgi:dienelactone hydrolase
MSRHPWTPRQIRRAWLCALPWLLHAGAAWAWPDAARGPMHVNVSFETTALPTLETLHALPVVPADMNETVIRIPADAGDSVELETTVFKPDGDGPFPMVVFNHGKERGDPRAQKRSRPLAFAREFVRRGYVVVAPNRRGFAHSGGTYEEDGCNTEDDGLVQAGDVAAAIDYMRRQPYVDPHHILVAGSSYGGLSSIAYGELAAPGVLGLVNFAGGLRQDSCHSWESNLTQAFAAYGQAVHLPTLWFYGDNDQYWPAALIKNMFTAFADGGSDAHMVDFGNYKDNAHKLVGDRDGVAIWWPPLARFLGRIGLPTAVRYRLPPAFETPPPSGYAQLDAAGSVPYVDSNGRQAYQAFLQQYPSRAFALSDSGAWAWAEGGDDPLATALASCQKNSSMPCHLYAVDNTVVWNDRQ